MDFTVLNERLLHTVLDLCKVAISLLLIGILILLVTMVYYCKTKDNAGFSLLRISPFRKIYRNKYTTKEQIGFDIVAIFAILLLIGSSVIPVHKDISKQQYVQAVAHYSRNSNDSKGSLFSNGCVLVNVDGHEFFLQLPVDWSDDEFPLGSYYGTVCYGENSKIILSFTPLDINS